MNSVGMINSIEVEVGAALPWDVTVTIERS
jgi:hypothetical protein